MKLFGIAGWSGSGKTTLLVALLPCLVRRGLRVSTVKHAHHSFDVDAPGKDSYRHREAGAAEVMLASANRWALMHEHRGAPEPELEALVAKMSPADLVLVEGFKRGPHDKLEVHRPSLGRTLLADQDPSVVAIASDAPLPGQRRPVLPLSEPERIAEFIVRHCALGSRAA